MTKFFLTLAAAAALAAPALADPAQKITFKRDGINYVATVRNNGAVQYIDGYEVETGRSFNLRVKASMVSGTFGGYDVSYPVPKSAQAMQTASR